MILSLSLLWSREVEINSLHICRLISCVIVFRGGTFQVLIISKHIKCLKSFLSYLILCNEYISIPSFNKYLLSEIVLTSVNGFRKRHTANRHCCASYTFSWQCWHGWLIASTWVNNAQLNWFSIILGVKDPR